MKNKPEFFSEILLNLKFSEHKNIHNHFSKFFSKAKRILLLPGNDSIDQTVLLELLRFFWESEKHVTVLIPANILSSLSSFSKVEFLTYNPIDINFFGFPKSNILNYFSEAKFDIIIDLSISKNLFNMYLVKFLHAEFAIGFERQKADKYYNFQIKPEINSEKSYRNLLNSLRMF